MNSRSVSSREWIIALVLGVAWIATLLLAPRLGPWVVTQIYDEAWPVEPLNRLLGGRSTHPVEYYIQLGAPLVESWPTRLFSGIFAVAFLYTHGLALVRTGKPAAAALSPLLLGSILLLAWSNRFIQDDAFISFRYAEHFANGHGLTWNLGEPPVEDYTNPLWTVLMSIAIRAGLEPVATSWGLGMICFVVTLCVGYRATVLVAGCPGIATWATALIGFNYTFSSYATGGLETQLQATLLVSTFYLLASSAKAADRSAGRAVAISLITAAAVLTRLDSVIPLAVLYTAFLSGIWKSGDDGRTTLRYLVALLGPGLLIGALYAAWKLSYYGELLPNTYHLKTSSTSARRGLKYIWNFLCGYGWLPFVLFVIARPRALRDTLSWSRPLLAIATLWFAYIIKVGGGFMEYRFFVAIMPFVALLIAASVSASLHEKARVAVLAGLIGMSFYHARTFMGRSGIESIYQLNEHIEFGRWDELGKRLNAMFVDKRPEVIISTNAAGAIPFYSKLRTVDSLGLNDAWVARNGDTYGTRPGHQRIATAAYLKERRVNLVIDYPQLERSQGFEGVHQLDRLSFLWTQFNASDLEENSCVIELPVGDGLVIYALYLMPNPVVDTAIREHNLHTVPILRP